MISFTIPGAPVAKARARSTSDGRHYTPAKTMDYEHKVAVYARQAMAGWVKAGNGAMLIGPITVRVYAHLPIPSSWSKKKQADAAKCMISPTSRPDLDNYIKSVLDGMNGIVFHDDAQVVYLCAGKAYSADPRVYVEVEEC
jgi:Holliday junction resolvase RusA-like endonuclease